MGVTLVLLTNNFKVKFLNVSNMPVGSMFYNHDSAFLEEELSAWEKVQIKEDFNWKLFSSETPVPNIFQGLEPRTWWFHSS